MESPLGMLTNASLSTIRIILCAGAM